jgi:hypothetical protein
MLTLWLFCLAFVLICWGLYKVVSSFTNLLFREKQPSIDDPLESYKESNAIDRMIQQNPLDTLESISQRYEAVMDSPLDYSEEERSNVAREYKELLMGHIKDPEAYHAPDERRDGYLNSDYVRYLKNQVRVLGPDCWHKDELKRVRQIDKEEQVGIDFRAELMKMGAIPALVHAMTTDKRMETYDTNDWKNLIAATNEYAEEFRLGRILYFLEQVDDKETLLDHSKMELFDLLIEKDVPEKVAGVFMRTEMEDEEIACVLELLDQDCTIDEALTLVLTKKKRDIETEIARRDLNSAIL